MRERRAYQRFRCEVPVYLQNAEGEEYALQCMEISIGGMRIEADKVLLAKLLPGYLSITPADQVIMDMRIDVRVQEQSWQLLKGQPKKSNPESWLALKAHIVGVTRLAENRFAVHVSFYEVTAEQDAVLQNFVRQLKA